jgi:CHAD domain-containing protein
VKDGLRRSYKRGRVALKASRRSPTDERLHEWRKRAKDLWYQVRLFKKSWPPVLKAWLDESHALTEALGKDHDYAMLSSTLAERKIVVDSRLRTSLVGRINRQRDELQQTAWTIGDRIYAERPRWFGCRMRGYWDSWRRDE